MNVKSCLPLIVCQHAITAFVASLRIMANVGKRPPSLTITAIELSYRALPTQASCASDTADYRTTGCVIGTGCVVAFAFLSSCCAHPTLVSSRNLTAWQRAGSQWSPTHRQPTNLYQFENLCCELCYSRRSTKTLYKRAVLEL